MPSSFLHQIAQSRERDPLAPVTVVVPSHVAAIQLRRRLAAEHGAFAGVRFETLPRLAELIGAGDLARSGRAPLARPIGDFLAAEVARDARDDLALVRHLPGFARVLRQTFRRLRRGGFERPEHVAVPLTTGLLGEVVRLYSLFRARSSSFYDDEDLLDAAAQAVDRRRDAVRAELGTVYVLPPGALSAGAERMLRALRSAVGASHYKPQPDVTTSPRTSFILAPDPASEAREVVREVLAALDEGAGLHEVAVFHGADPAYRALLAQAFEASGVPVSAMPGTPLSETAAGRGVLMLAELPLQNYSRTATIDWLSLAPLRDFLPSAGGSVAWLPAAWRRLAREAGVTQGLDRWQSGLSAMLTDIEARMTEFEEDDARRERAAQQQAQVTDLGGLIEALTARLETLRQPRPAASFIEDFKAVVEAYLDPDATALPAVLAQVDQLGTIAAVGGQFSLESFVAALRANLEAAYHREGSVGEGVLVADYRLAAGLSFEHVVLCGAYEGVFPPGPAAEPLVEDRLWHGLRRSHPMIEDADLRIQRAREQAQRAIAAAGGRLVWTAPLQAPGAGRDHYPAHLMLQAAEAQDARLTSATDLRRAPAAAWLRRPASPLVALLTGPAIDLAEVRIRSSLAARRDGVPLAAGHAVAPALALLRGRRGDRFGEYDGNLGALAGDELIPRGTVSPTSLEYYANCGYRYFLNAVMRLRPPEEPEDHDMMDARDRGTVVHETLQEFFQTQAERGRPARYEPWTEADRVELLAILERRMDEARERGKTGLDVFAEHERRRLRADLSAFLDEDTLFRLETGAVPSDFEVRVEQQEGNVVMRGFADRVDRTPDGAAAWIIDYKTGTTTSYAGMKEDDPLAGGSKLQLPVYVAAAGDARQIVPLYWFISSIAGFARLHFEANEANMQRYRETLAAIVEGIRRGAFPAHPGDENTYYGGWENCIWCDFKRLCSRRRDDEFEAKLEDPAIRPWQQVSETARGGST